MNASTITSNVANEPNRQVQREKCDQYRKQQEDELFEARLQWFLAVSRNA